MTWNFNQLHTNTARSLLSGLAVAIATCAIAAPALAGTRTPDAAPASVLVDSHGTAVMTKDAQAVSIAESKAPVVTPEKAPEPAKKVAKKKGKKAKAKKAAPKADVKKDEKAAH